MAQIPTTRGNPQASDIAVQSALPFNGGLSREDLQTVLNTNDADIAKLYEDRNALLTDGGLISYTGTQVQFTEDLKLEINSKVAGGSPVIINLGQATLDISANGRMIYAVIDRSLGTAVVTDDSATLPAVVAANKEVFLIAKRSDSDDGIKRLYFRSGTALDEGDTVRLGASGSGDGGGGTLAPIPGYNWLETDDFSVSPTNAVSKVDSTNTKATHNIAAKSYIISCDKTKTVSTSSGTALTISGAPTFTVAAGDIVYVTSGARSGQWRKIASISSQTSYTLDAVFTGGNASGGDTLMVSQAVWTKDLVNLGSVTEKTRARDFFSGNILQIAVDYFDSLTSGDTIPDYVDTARLVMGASNEGLVGDTGLPLSSEFGNQVFTRAAAPNTIQNYVLSTNADQQRLHLVFFCNPANGSVTASANLMGYECSLYEDGSLTNSGVLEDALCFSDNSTTPINCTVSTPAGLTRVALSWSYTPNVNSGGPTGQLEVWVNGKEVSRFVGSGSTPSTDLYYTEQTDSNGIYSVVQFTSDLSVTPVEIKVVRRFGVYDASDENSAKIASLNEAIVGSTAQITAGIATHSTLQAAHDAIVAGGKILVLNNVSISGAVTLSKQCMVEGKGPGSTITGNLTVASGAAKSIIFALRVDGNITFNSGADKCFMTHCYQTASKTFSNDPSNLDNVIDVITE